MLFTSFCSNLRIWCILKRLTLLLSLFSSLMNLEVGRNPHLGYFMEPRAVSLGPRTVTKTKITKEECTFISTLKQSPPPPPPLEVPGTYIVLE